MPFKLTFDQVVSYLLAGNFSILLFALVLLYIFKKEPFKIFAYFKERKDKRQEQSLALVDSDHISPDAKELIKESLEYSIYERYAGVRTDRETRLILYAFNEKYRDKLNRKDIKWAYRHMVFDGGEVNIQLSKGHVVMRWITTTYSWSLGVLGLILAIASIIEKYDNPVELVTFIVLAAVFMFTGLFVSSANFPYHSARKIQQLIEDAKQEDQGTSKDVP